MMIQHRWIVLLLCLSASQALHAGDRQFWFGSHNKERLALFCAGASVALIGFGLYSHNSKPLPKPVSEEMEEVREQLRKTEAERQAVKGQLAEAQVILKILVQTGQVRTVRVK